jgi:hypothetical protein
LARVAVRSVDEDGHYGNVGAGARRVQVARPATSPW